MDAYKIESSTGSWIVLQSASPHEQTGEFAPLLPTESPQQFQEPSLWRRKSSPPPVFGGPPSMSMSMGWLSQLLRQRRRPKPVDLEPYQSLTTSKTHKAKMDALVVSILRMAKSCEAKGEIPAKIMLSRQSGRNELKNLCQRMTQCAQEAFEDLPPYLALISEADFKPSDSCESPPYVAEMDISNLSLVNVEHMRYSMPVSAPPMPGQDDLFYDTHLPTAPPHTMMPFTPSPAFAPPTTGPSGVFCPPIGGPYGLPYKRSDYYPASSSINQHVKKLPSVGDRPLTPPAQGWYAKYSSGVTGVVWDRVHQAWVVSWTLAGKRTFRHFTCKSYGGFDKAREAAIEFRLARNRDIAAYNKKFKDRK